MIHLKDCFTVNNYQRKKKRKILNCEKKKNIEKGVERNINVEEILEKIDELKKEGADPNKQINDKKIFDVIANRIDNEFILFEKMISQGAKFDLNAEELFGKFMDKKDYYSFYELMIKNQLLKGIELRDNVCLFFLFFGNYTKIQKFI